MLVEEFGMAASADKGDRVGRKLINEQPIPSQMTFAVVFHVSDKLVVSVDGWECF